MNSFNSITAMICYKCKTVGLVALRLTWSDGDPIALQKTDELPILLQRSDRGHIFPTIQLGNMKNNLDVFFISCTLCQRFSRAHNPRKSWLPLHVDLQP